MDIKFRKRVAKIIKRNLGRLDVGHKILENSLVIFIYHEVSNQPSPFMEEHNLNVKPALFIQHMDFIRSNFNIIDPDQLLEGKYEKPAALITFDDGMKSYFLNALPIMSDRNIPSLNFLNMATIEGEVSWTGLISYLTRYDRNFCDIIRRDGHQQKKDLDFTLYPPKTVRDYLLTIDFNTLKEKINAYTGALANCKDLESVRDSRLVFFGNHLYNHYSTISLDEHELRRQFRLNEQILRSYPNSRAMFAYPFGRYALTQTEQLMSLGAEVIFYSNGGINRNIRDNFYDRIEIDSSVETFEDFTGRIQWMKIRNSILGN